MIVGAGGKMGPTLAVLAARAVADSGSKLKIIAVSRFSDPAQKNGSKLAISQPSLLIF